MRVDIAGFRHSSCVIFAHQLIVHSRFLVFLHIVDGERGEGGRSKRG